MKDYNCSNCGVDVDAIRGLLDMNEGAHLLITQLQKEKKT